jgi:lipopolysaccharide transport system ATP-binding protein
MIQSAIRIQNLSKRYRIGLKEEKKDTLGATIAHVLKKPIRNFKRLRSLGKFGPEDNAADIIWALKNINFEVPEGQVLGIIGKNGAGKSTLLKILSRITEPTSGHIEIRGKVSSLLEVGTGFHPELTGRENVYLNGTILGMSKKEIDGKFDEIVEFSGVEKFIDTPIKWYSSGMKVRLAFSVAAHLEPEILIVDEVLAVGDADFQRKCINKMEAVGSEGRTVLFVSHNMPAITRLCSRVILIDNGEVRDDGDANAVVSRYLSSDIGIKAEKVWTEPLDAPRNEIVRAWAVRVVSETGTKLDAVDVRDSFDIELQWEVLEPGHRIIPEVNVMNEEALRIFTSIDLDPEWRGRTRPVGRYTSRVKIPGNLLSEGMFILNICFFTEDPYVIHCKMKQVVAFTVYDNLEGDSARGDYGGRLHGVIRPFLEWKTQFEPAPAAGDKSNGSEGHFEKKY